MRIPYQENNFSQTNPGFLKQKPKKFVRVVAYFLAALMVFAIFLHVSRFNGYRRVYFSDMIYGRAWRPFVYRVLLPQTAHLITAPIPVTARNAINENLDSSPFLHNIFRVIGWEKEYLSEYVIAAGLMFLCLLGFGWALGYLYSGIVKSSHRVGKYLPFLGVLALPPLFSYTYIYDFSTLFLFTLGLAFLVRKKWIWYFFIYLAGCLNKETTVLLTVIFLFYYWKDMSLGRNRFIRLLLGQFAIFIIIRLLLQWIFRNNQGTSFEFHLTDHNLPLLYQLIKPYTFLTLITILFFGYIFIYKWSMQPRFLKLGFYSVVPVLFLLTLLFGFLEEWRDYYEAYPIIILIFTFSIRQIIRGNRVENPAEILFTEQE